MRTTRSNGRYGRDATAKTIALLLTIVANFFYTSDAFCSRFSINVVQVRIKNYVPNLKRKQISLKNRSNHNERTLHMSNLDDEVNMQLNKAREILAKAKAKIAEKEKEEKSKTESGKTSKIDKETKKERVLKTENPESGLFTTDGDMMAELAEEEDWEMRSIVDVFQQEFSNDDAERRAADKKERDIALAMFNLRKSMLNDDYEKIFNKRDWKIGDV